MNTTVQETINLILDRSGGLKRTYFEDVMDRLSPKEAMEVYVECSIRDINFDGDLAYKTDVYGDRHSKKKNPIKSGYYPYVRFYPGEFVEVLTKVIKTYGVKSFLDVGAGYGDKVAIAKKFLQIADGIEYYDKYVRKAKKYGVTLKKADAFDFESFHNYELIYMYHPIAARDLYIKLVQTIMDKMAPGAFLLEVLPYTIESYVDEGKLSLKGFKKIACKQDGERYILLRKNGAS